jgi:hypothetical protein
VTVWALVKPKLFALDLALAILGTRRVGYIFELALAVSHTG